MSVYIWLPDPHDFVRLNFKELKGLIEYVCKPEWNVQDFLTYVIDYLLSHKLKYEKKYKNKQGKHTKISTYVFETMRYIKLKYFYEVIEDKGKAGSKALKRGMVPVQYIEERERVMSEAESASDTALKFRMFKKYLIREHGNRKKLKHACKILDLGIRGYSSGEIAKKLKVRGEYISQVKAIIKEKLNIFNKESNLCVI